jgi:uncharacterized membrane protein
MSDKAVGRIIGVVIALIVMGLVALALAQPTGTNTANLAQGMISVGPKPVLTGTCTTGGQIGGTFAGSFTATCAAQTVIMTFPFPAPNGWACDTTDQTTAADNLNQTSSTTTSATFTGTTAAADVVSFKCAGY